jgi:hypothetical protein
MARTTSAKEKESVPRKATRHREYRIPAEIHPTKRVFPTMVELFRFIQGILLEISEYNPEVDQEPKDADVVRFIYPGYPYAHQLKRGMKNLHDVSEIFLLARHLGVPVEWILKIRTGEWTEKDALKAYKERAKEYKGGVAQTTLFGGKGIAEITVKWKKPNREFLGELYAGVIQETRKAILNPAIDSKEGDYL